MPDIRSNSSISSLWKAVPRSVWTTSEFPKRPKYWKMHDADSTTVVVLVGYSSTHRENASMITKMNMLPCTSGRNGPMWSKWRTSKGYYDAHVNGRVLMVILRRLTAELTHSSYGHLTTWALPNELTDHPVSYWGVVEAFLGQGLPPVAQVGIMHCSDLSVLLLWYHLLSLQLRQDCWTTCCFSWFLFGWHVVFT